MSRPPVSVRLAGSPLGAILLFVMYGAVIVGWYEGHMGWWLALGAVAASSKTLQAIKKVRRYKSWLADWQAMNAEMQPTQPVRSVKKTADRGRREIITASALFIVLPLCAGSLADDHALASALIWLWLLDCLFLIFTLLRRFQRRLPRINRKAAEVTKAEPEDAPVAWLLARPSSSPSRMDAIRRLPEYSARLIRGAP